jgi:hypothetical protein
MTRESEFLIAATRFFVGSSAEADLDELEQAVDWITFIPLAIRHGVLGMLPKPPGREFREQVREQFALTAELLRLLPLFEAQRLPVVPLKGPVLATTIYGDVGVRASSDLDLLIHKQDVRRTHDLLLSEGYRLHSILPWPGDLRNKESELSFEREDGGVRVDLHWSLIPEYLPQPVNEERLWTNLQPTQLGGREVMSLGDEDLLLFLCCHGAKHLWERLSWICDTAKFIQVRPDLDWDRVMRSASEQHCTRFLLLGLAVAENMLGGAVPKAILELAHRDEIVQSRTRLVSARLFSGAPSPPPGTEQVRFNLPLIETIQGRIRYIHGMILAPTAAEFRVLQVPVFLYGIYYPFRAVRLCLKSVWLDHS